MQLIDNIMIKKIKIGTRGSKLALWQADWVKSEIKKKFPDLEIQIVKIKTTGDKILDRPLSMIGGKGLFVKEIEKALFEKTIDIAVHSMKDMPGILPKGLVNNAVPIRENPFDVLISKNNISLKKLPLKATIGTSSMRRASQIKHIRPDLKIKSIRGNINTRIKKMESGEFDGILLAAAGLIRLGIKDKITEYFDENTMLPACGQGALCIESRQDNQDIKSILQIINHPKTQISISGERAFLKQIQGDCHIPVACFGKIKKEKIILTGLIASENGEEIIKDSITTHISLAKQAGIDLANQLLSKGGKKILENLKTK